MKLFLSVILALVIVGCASRGAYTSLAATEQAATASYSAYVDGVISGKTPTNNLPAVSSAFNLFQLSMRTAIDATGTSNAPVTPQVLTAKSNLDQTISVSKGAP